MQVLYASQEDMEEVPHGDGTEVRQQAYDQAMKLRRLEFELMERAYEDFEKQVCHPSQSVPTLSHCSLELSIDAGSAAIRQPCSVLVA
jgi:hypothetical protein